MKQCCKNQTKYKITGKPIRHFIIGQKASGMSYFTEYVGLKKMADKFIIFDYYGIVARND